LRQEKARERASAMCPHTTICVSSYYYMYVSSYYYMYVSSYYNMCPHTTMYLSSCYYMYVSSYYDMYVSSYCYICFLTPLHVSSHYYMCPHTPIYVSSYYYICPHSTLSVCRGRARPAGRLCCLILLYVPSLYTECVQGPSSTGGSSLQPHTTIYALTVLCMCAGAELDRRVLSAASYYKPSLQPHITIYVLCMCAGAELDGRVLSAAAFPNPAAQQSRARLRRGAQFTCLLLAQTYKYWYKSTDTDAEGAASCWP
jgi:hypothetical protein